MIRLANRRGEHYTPKLRLNQFGVGYLTSRISWTRATPTDTFYCKSCWRGRQGLEKCPRPPSYLRLMVSTVAVDFRIFATFTGINLLVLASRPIFTDLFLAI